MTLTIRARLFAQHYRIARRYCARIQAARIAWAFATL